MNSRRVRERGFSLIELSVVVLIIGILLTMGISAMTSSFENTAVSTTSQKQGAIKEALISYLRRNSRLPCPDTDFAAPDGAENRATPNDPTTACSARFGILPYVTLGLARDAVRDGWGNFFSYHVANTTAAALPDSSTGANTDWTITANFRSGNSGNITVNDRTVAGAITPLSTQIVVMIVSHGRNGLGAYSVGGTRNTLPAAGTDELENTNGTADMVYFRRDPTTNDAATGGAFDDQVMFLSASDLLDPLFRDGSLRSPQASAYESMVKIKLAVIANAVNFLSADGGTNCDVGGAATRCRVIVAADTNDGIVDVGNGNNNGNLPYTTLGLALMADGLDPWGIRYKYTLPTPQVINTNDGISSLSPVGTAVAFTITSWGPDRLIGGTDNISLSVTVGEIRTYMIGMLP